MKEEGEGGGWGKWDVGEGGRWEGVGWGRKEGEGGGWGTGEVWGGREGRKNSLQIF